MLRVHSCVSMSRRRPVARLASPPTRNAHCAQRSPLAGRQIATLADGAGGEGAQILEFQVASLEDEEFLEPMFAAILDGVAADAAWISALDGQIAYYNSASDEYLRARSSDLADLRDRVLRALRGGDGATLKIPRGAVVYAEDLPPSRFLEIDWSDGGGLALMRGSPTSHVAMLSRARGIPMVVQLGAVSTAAVTALLDGEGATLELDPSPEQIGLFQRRRELHRKNRASARAILHRPAASWDGEKIRLLINIQDGRGYQSSRRAIRRRRRPDANRVFAHRSYGIARRRHAIHGLRQRAALGWDPAGDNSDLRCRRRQASAGIYRG